LAVGLAAGLSPQTRERAIKDYVEDCRALAADRRPDGILVDVEQDPDTVSLAEREERVQPGHPRRVEHRLEAGLRARPDDPKSND